MGSGEGDKKALRSNYGLMTFTPEETKNSWKEIVEVGSYICCETYTHLPYQCQSATLGIFFRLQSQMRVFLIKIMFKR